MEEDITPKPTRRPQFSLRYLFVVTAIAALFCALFVEERLRILFFLLTGVAFGFAAPFVSVLVVRALFHPSIEHFSVKEGCYYYGCVIPVGTAFAALCWGIIWISAIVLFGDLHRAGWWWYPLVTAVSVTAGLATAIYMILRGKREKPADSNQSEERIEKGE